MRLPLSEKGDFQRYLALIIVRLGRNIRRLIKRCLLLDIFARRLRQRQRKRPSLRLKFREPCRANPMNARLAAAQADRWPAFHPSPCRFYAPLYIPNHPAAAAVKHGLAVGPPTRAPVVIESLNRRSARQSQSPLSPKLNDGITGPEASYTSSVAPAGRE